MNCVIIEDEVPAQEILTAYLNKVPELKLIGIFNTALKANSIFKEKRVDILFLDINLPNLSGLQFLKTLKQPPLVIMTTAYGDYAVESFEFETIIDYLVKPFSFERFLKSINKIQSRQQPQSQIQYQSPESISSNLEFVFINVDKTLHKIDLKNMVYVQSDRNYVSVVSKDINLSFIDSLKNWNSYLNRDNFLQVHRSYIINLDFIEKLTGNIVYLDGHKIPVGKTFKEDLFKRVKPIN